MLKDIIKEFDILVDSKKIKLLNNGVNLLIRTEIFRIEESFFNLNINLKKIKETIIVERNGLQNILKIINKRKENNFYNENSIIIKKNFDISDINFVKFELDNIKKLSESKDCDERKESVVLFKKILEKCIDEINKKLLIIEKMFIKIEKIFLNIDREKKFIIKIEQKINISGEVEEIKKFSTWWNKNIATVIVKSNNDYSVFLILIDKKITNKGKIKNNEIFVYPINSDCKWWGEKERGQWSSLELAQKEVNGLITEFTKVNGKYYNNPILLIHPRCGVKTEFVDILACPYVTKEEINLSETEVNFDKYFRVGDIVESEREKFWFFNFYHSAIYLGKNKVCHMLNESNFQGVKINFFNDENYFWKRLSSGRLGKLFLVHPIIPFKHISLIAEQINRTNNNLWKDNYCLHRRNCQHYAYSVSLGINYSWEVWEKRERIAFIDMPFVDYLNDSLKHKKLDEINNGKKDKITLTEEFEETNKLLNINSDIFSNNLVEQIKQNYFEQIIEPIKIDDCLIM